MKKPEKTAQKSLMERLKELGQKHGVKVTDMSEHGVRAIGIIGGIQKTKPNVIEAKIGRTDLVGRRLS